MDHHDDTRLISSHRRLRVGPNLFHTGDPARTQYRGASRLRERLLFAPALSSHLGVSNVYQEDTPRSVL